MKQVLICKKCEESLSVSLTILKDGEDTFPTIIWKDQEPICDQGVVLKSLKAMQVNTDPNGPKPYLDFTPQYWMRLDDLLQSVGNVENNKVWSGCCGPSGDNGPNRKCKCGEPVGSERNDCWTSKVFIPDNEKTKWKNVK